ncbi:MAG: hypothetical protein NVV73_12895 [Cellvibrionaceae bacterium]|nr:hypothetical protein [Cellvibrionaceae bacterium]
MVKITYPPPPSPTPRPHNRTSGVETSAPINKEKQDLPPGAPPVERRKPNSDRRMHSAARGPFNLRSGRDRRKNSGGHIEEDV